MKKPEQKTLNTNTHNIKKLWEENIPNYQSVLPDQIKKAFAVLEKYHILEDAQLFRYYADKKGVELNSMPPLKDADFNALSDAIWSIRQAVLECIHIKKGFPL